MQKGIRKNAIRSGAVIFIFAALFVSLARAAADTAFIKKMSGKVTVSRGSKKMDVKVNDKLKEKDVVSVGLKGQADVQFYGKSMVRLLELTNFTIKESTSKKTTLNFTSGNILVKVKKLAKGEDLKVETPVAVLGIRGTQFWGQVRKEGEKAASTLAVREGAIWVQPKGSEEVIEVKVGFALDLEEGQKEFQVRDAKPEEMGAMEQIDQMEF